LSVFYRTQKLITITNDHPLVLIRRQNKLLITLAFKLQLLTRRGEGKAVPLQAWTGPECSRMLKFPDFVTTAQDGGDEERRIANLY